MATGDWTKQEADATKEAVDELFSALPKTKQMQYLGHLNDVLVFLGKAKDNAPDGAA